MLAALRARDVHGLPDRVRFQGRILFLTADPALIRRQLEGHDLEWTPALKLRDDSSTDEITPAYLCYYYDETLGDFPYLGHKCGEEIPLATFSRGEGEITRGIIEYGGLFNYNVARLQGKVTLRPPVTVPRPMTLGEKILARHWVVDPAAGRVGVPSVRPGDEGFVRTDIRFSHEYVTPMAAIFFEQLVGKDAKVNDPGSILMFRDHLTFLPEAMTPERVKEGLLDVAMQLEKKQREFATVQGIKLYGELRLGHHGSEAICHSKIREAHALPGQVIIGSDSHTPHAGAVGCIAFGVGTTA